MARSSGAGPLMRVFATDHRIIGLQYFFLSLAAVAVGIVLSLLMRVHIVWPNAHIPLLGVPRPEDYLAWLTIHGTLMVFFVLSIAPQSAFGNIVLPRQIGAREMAFPRWNAVSFWLTLLSFGVTIAALFASGGGPTAGWTQYAPLSSLAAAGPGQGLGTDLWLVSILIFCIASVTGSVNFVVTVMRKRADGMAWMRLPLTAWAWFVTAAMSSLAFSVLAAADLLLLCDRHFGSSFFVPSGLIVNGVAAHHAGGSPLLWQHLFWFFGHPEVYIAILPGMGVTSHLLSVFARRPVFGYRAMVVSTIAIGVLGFQVWGHHMFVSGMNPYAGFVFSSLTLAIAIPSSVKVFNWLGTLWRGSIRFNTAMLFSLGFVSLFTTGGLTGPILAQPQLDAYLHDTYFVVAHFHLIMGMAAVFAIIAATYFWFPIMFGRMMNERLGQLHFWLTFVLAYATFMPMHLLGMAGQPRRYSQLAGSADYVMRLLPMHRFITICALALGAAQALFFINVFWSIFRGCRAAHNPWNASNLEWASQPGSEQKLLVTRGPYEYSGSAEFVMQADVIASPSNPGAFPVRRESPPYA